MSAAGHCWMSAKTKVPYASGDQSGRTPEAHGLSRPIISNLHE